MEEDESKSPQKGERVDSINYYRKMLDKLNDKIEVMQKEAKVVAEEENNLSSASEWIAHVISKTTNVAASSLVSIQLFHLAHNNAIQITTDSKTLSGSSRGVSMRMTLLDSKKLKAAMASLDRLALTSYSVVSRCSTEILTLWSTP